MNEAAMHRRSFLAGGVFAATTFVSVRSEAHHGWGAFDTRYAYFAAGPLVRVRWGDPHGVAALKVENTTIPADWASRSLPRGATEREGQATMASARPYAGGRETLDLILAGPSWMERWGLRRPLVVGERIEVVGFPATDGDAEFRPVMFWLADGQGVWQQLTAFPRRPEPAPPR